MYQILLGALLFLAGMLGATLASATVCLIARKKAGKKWGGNERSHCDHCGHVLGVVDLIPIFGYLINKGRCRYCKEKIPAASVITEIIWAIGFAIAVYYGLTVFF